MGTDRGPVSNEIPTDKSANRLSTRVTIAVNRFWKECLPIIKYSLGKRMGLDDRCRNHSGPIRH